MNVPARKRFGQHFLHDAEVIERIVTTIRPRADQHIVEIGPGRGALTTALLPHAGTLDAVELDRDLIPGLESACRGLGTLRVHAADALRFDFTAIAQDGRPLRLTGNLPYNISTPLLFHLLDHIQVIADMHFMLQQEVVTRMAAAPGGRDYGRLSVMLQYHCRVEKLFSIPPEAFHPRPRVLSALVRLVPHATPPSPADDMEIFTRLVRVAFSMRRKTLRNCLRSLLSPEAMRTLDIDPGARPETLTLEQFVALANAAGREPGEH